MRALLCCAFALLIPSAAWAERITITAASATYWSATDELEIRVWFDSPLVVPPDYFSFGGRMPRDENGIAEWFFFNSAGRTAREVMEPWTISHDTQRYDGRYEVLGETIMGVPDVEIDGRTFTATMPFAMTGFDDTQFTFGTTVIRDGKSHGLDGVSAIDRRIVYTPEPSSAALASFGVVALLVHLSRRPRFR